MPNFPPQPYPFAKVMRPVCTLQPLYFVVHLPPYLHACTLWSRYLLTSLYSVTSFLGTPSLLPFFWTRPKLTLQLADTRVPQITQHHSKGCDRTHRTSKCHLCSLALSSTLTCSPVCQAAARPAGEPSLPNPSQTSLPAKEAPPLSKHHLNFIPLCVHCCWKTKTGLPPKSLGIHNSALMMCSSLPLHLPLP